jgi:hypothetical protein
MYLTVFISLTEPACFSEQDVLPINEGAEAPSSPLKFFDWTMIHVIHPTRRINTAALSDGKAFLLIWEISISY